MEKAAAANTEGAAPANSSPIAEDEKTTLSGLPAQAIGHIGDTPDPKLSQSTMERASAIQSGFEAALADSEKHGEQPADGETDVIPAMADRSSEVPIAGQSAISDTRSPEGLKGNVQESESTSTSTADQPDESIVSKIGQSVNNAVNYVSESVSETVQGSSSTESKATTTEEHTKPQMTDNSVQTGQQDITVKSPTGEQEKMTLHLGGRAHPEGNVVVKDGEEIVGDMDERHRTATTGHGM